MILLRLIVPIVLGVGFGLILCWFIFPSPSRVAKREAFRYLDAEFDDELPRRSLYEHALKRRRRS